MLALSQKRNSVPPEEDKIVYQETSNIIAKIGDIL